MQKYPLFSKLKQIDLCFIYNTKKKPILSNRFFDLIFSHFHFSNKVFFINMAIVIGPTPPALV
jgi:hypothetical protein